jgi:hypothetical protein
MNDYFNQAELAAELNCHRSTIARYVRRGMPTSSRSEALEWLARWTSGFGGGWTGGSRPEGLAQRAGRLLETEQSAPPQDARAAYEALRLRFTELPRRLLEFDPDAADWLVIAVCEFADSVAGALALSVDFSGQLELIPLWEDQERLPSVERAIFTAAGRKLTAKQWKSR